VRSARCRYAAVSWCCRHAEPASLETRAVRECRVRSGTQWRVVKVGCRHVVVVACGVFGSAAWCGRVVKALRRYAPGAWW